MRLLSAALLSATLFALPAAAQNPLELLVQQQSHYWFTVESLIDDFKWLEAADDFDLVADVHRVRAQGHACWSCLPGDLHSARLAFYEWTPSGPGALQAEYVFQDGDPGLLYSDGPGLIDFTLPAPFQATGPHFLSVQVEVTGFWAWHAANYNEPIDAKVYSRTEPDGPWAPHEITYPAGPANSDMAFELYGVDDTPPTAGTDPCGDWTVVPTPQPVDGFSVLLRDVDAVASDDVWAVGDYIQEYSVPFGWNTLSWIQHFDGEAWTHVESPHPEPYENGGRQTLYAVAAVASEDVWAAGSYRTQNPSGGSLGTQIFIVHWDGSSWTQVPAPVSATGSGPFVRDILALGPDDIWFFGQWLGFEAGALGERRSLAMHWDGSSFEVTDSPFFDNKAGYGGGHSIESGSATGPDDIWAVGGAHSSDFSPHSYIIHWDGSSWAHVPGPTPGLFNRLFSVEALAPDDVWAGGAYSPAEGGGYIPFFLHWDGNSWTQVDTPGGGSTLVQREEAGDLITSAGIYGGQGIFRYDGTAWSPVMDFPTSTNPTVWALARVPGEPCEVWGVGRQNGPDAGGLTVRLQPAGVPAQVQTVEPCGVPAPAQSLVASPTPQLGKKLSVAAGDPTSSASVGAGTVAVLILGSTLPGGCGTVLPGLGPDAAAGELLVGAPYLVLGAETWGGPNAPAVFDLGVPDEATLSGATVGVQALFIDPSDGDQVLSRGLALTFGI